MIAWLQMLIRPRLTHTIVCNLSLTLTAAVPAGMCARDVSELFESRKPATSLSVYSVLASFRRSRPTITTLTCAENATDDNLDLYAKQSRSSALDEGFKLDGYGCAGQVV